MIRLFLTALLLSSGALASSITVGTGGTGSMAAHAGGSGSVTVENVAQAGGSGCADGGDIGTGTHNTALSVGSNQFRYSDFTPNTSGNITGCWAWNNNNTGDITIGVYDTSGNVLAYVNASGQSAQNWSGGLLNTSVCLEAGTTYYIGAVSNDASWNLYRQDTVTGVNRYQISMTYGATLSNADFSSPTVNASNTGWSITCNDAGAP